MELGSIDGGFRQPMKVFIVYAHQDPRSFNGIMRDLAIGTLHEQGHQVQVSDLYAMNFRAVSDRGDFADRRGGRVRSFQAEGGRLPPDIRAEQEKLRWCDVLIFQFPLWWFTLPAILKGWVDRVFTTGFTSGGGMWYDNGGLKGRRAMLALTAGGPREMYTRRGVNGDINQILFHIHHGMLYFVGFDVLPPFIAWGPTKAGVDHRDRYLQEYRHRLLTLSSTDPIPFPQLSDFDQDGQLRDGVKPVTA